MVKSIQIGDVVKKGMQIKNAATWNHSAHNLLSEMVNKSQNNEDVLMMVIPDVIICAFTCELYLKAMLCKENIKFNHVHRLNELFYLLDEDTQKFIEEETLRGLQHYAPNEIYNFNDVLEKNGNAFVEMRYFYENSLSIDYLFLKVFVIVLESISKQVFSQLA